MSIVVKFRAPFQVGPNTYMTAEALRKAFEDIDDKDIELTHLEETEDGFEVEVILAKLDFYPAYIVQENRMKLVSVGLGPKRED